MVENFNLNGITAPFIGVLLFWSNAPNLTLPVAVFAKTYHVFGTEGDNSSNFILVGS